MVKEKSISELKSRLENQEDFILLDVRTENEVLVSKITEDFIHIPMNEIPSKLSKINKNKEIIVYCKSGVRSAKVCEYLMQNNYSKVYNLKGGIIAWAKEVNPNMLIM